MTDPSTISGKILWLRGQDLLGAVGSSIATWPDQSGLSATVTGTAATVCDSADVTVAGYLASSEFGAGNNAAKAFNGNDGDGWITAATASGWLRAELSTASIASSYSLSVASGSRMPKDWTFEGSNDGSSWTTLDTQTNQTGWGAVRYFNFTNSTAYLYYRLNVSANNGDTYLSVAEMTIGVKTPTKGARFAAGRLDGGVTTTGTSRDLWMVVDARVGYSDALTNMGNSGSACYYPYFDGKIYDDTFISTRQNFTPTVTIWQNRRLVRITMTGGTWFYYLDAVQQATATSQTFSVGSTRRIVHAFTGTVHEALLLDAVSDSTQTADLITYFNTEHGLTVPGGSVPTATGTAPITVSSSSATTMPAVTTGTAAVTVSSSSATIGSVTTTGTAPVTVSSSALTTTPGVTTGTAPVTVESSSATVLIQGPLATWTSDLSQQAVAEFTSPAAILYVEAPAAEPPATIVERTILRNSIMLDPMTVDTDTGRVDPASFDATVTGEVGVYHVTVDGIDVTYWRDAPTVIGQMRFSEPGGEDSARLEFPQITSIDEAGTGDLTWLHTDAPVEIFILTPEGDRVHKFSGHLVSDNTGIGTALQSSWDVQGNIRQGDSIVHRVPTILDRTDIGILVPKYLNEVPGRRYAPIPPATTGITSKQRGSYSDTEWDYSQTLLGGAYELDGDQWTLTRSGINQYGIALKDRDTVHWTVTAGTPGIEFDLTEDVANLVNCIYGRGVGPDGYAWAGWCHPNLLPDDAPDYPMFPITDLIEVGVDDGDTTTGEGVTTWQRRVQSLGYSITVDGVYSSSDALVCRQVQTDYGLLVDGKVGPQTWAATFDTGSGGGDLNGSYRRPLAILSAVDPYLYAANGAIVGANPDYDPAIIRRERNVDYGTGITKAEATVLAGMELARDSVTGWQGAITFKVDPREGSRHLMREGQNILLQGFRGGDVLLHISELSVDPSDDYMPVTVAVDSKARDAMSLSSVAERDRDSRADPARRPGNPARRSRQEQDMAVEYDGESGAGVIPHFPVYGGLWSVIRIPVSEVGNVKLTLATTSGPACEFSIGFFGLPLTPAHMNSLVGNPFTAGAWDTNAEVMDEQYAFLESFGNDSQACGYYPGGTTLTGRLKDTGSWEYISGKPPHIWVAIYATSTCFIEGRVYPAPVV